MDVGRQDEWNPAQECAIQDLGCSVNSTEAKAYSSMFGWPERALVALIGADVALSFVPRAALAAAVLTVVCYALGGVVLARFVRKNLKQALWRLRNRLLVSYLFIAVVPITLLMALIAISGYVLMGQV